MYSLSVASSCHKLMFLVHEADGRVRERLADYSTLSVSVSVIPSTQPHSWNRRKTTRRSRQKQRTFIARHLSLNDISDLAAGGEIGDCEHCVSPTMPKRMLHRVRSMIREEQKQGSLTAQISRNARSEQSTRCYGQRAAEIDHAGESAAVEDVEAVLGGC
jgi:hypothetical protein